MAHTWRNITRWHGSSAAAGTARLPDSSMLSLCRSSEGGGLPANSEDQGSTTATTEPWFIPAEEALYDALEQVRLPDVPDVLVKCADVC